MYKGEGGCGHSHLHNVGRVGGCAGTWAICAGILGYSCWEVRFGLGKVGVSGVQSRDV